MHWKAVFLANILVAFINFIFINIYSHDKNKSFQFLIPNKSRFLFAFANKDLEHYEEKFIFMFKQQNTNVLHVFQDQ